MRVFKIRTNKGKILYAEKQYDEREIIYTTLDKDRKHDIKLQMETGEYFKFSGRKSYINTMELMKTKEMDFTFDNENPMYLPFKKFLNEEQNSIVRDSNYDENKKSLEIIEENNSIKLIIRNEGQYSENIYNRFCVNIKNKEFEGKRFDRLGHEKSEDNSDKKRLITLFNDLSEALTQRKFSDINYTGKEDIER